MPLISAKPPPEDDRNQTSFLFFLVWFGLVLSSLLEGCVCFGIFLSHRGVVSRSVIIIVVVVVVDVGVGRARAIQKKGQQQRHTIGVYLYDDVSQKGASNL